MRLMRCLLVCAAAILTAGALTLAGTTAVTAAPAARHATRPDAGQPSVRFLAKARRALVSYLRTSHPVITLTGPEPGAPDHLAGTSMESSYNWSGYADASSTAGTFSEVGGQWQTPDVLCGSEDQISAQWIGLDGFNSSTVEQDGTISWCFESKATYFTWWEMYPSGSVEVGSSVRPGDLITAKVSRTGPSYTLSLADHTHPANSFSVSQSCTSCTNTSAEWISERPAFPIGVVPLANYIHWSLNDATETAGGRLGTISTYPDNFKINMIDATDSYRLSVASPLAAGGHRFVTTWLNSY